MTTWSHVVFKEAYMPRETFFNLPKDKRDHIITAAIKEFSQAGYSTASTNQICKKSGIPKGSFYQYFTDKLDLYVYIMTLAIEEKIRFFSVALTEFPALSLLEQIRLLFTKGIEFAKTHPQYAALGEQFSKESDESAKSAVIKEGDKRSDTLFLQMIDQAKAKGEIDDSVDAQALSLLLQSLNSAVNSYMQDRYGSLSYEEHEKDMKHFIESLLNILYRGIKK